LWDISKSKHLVVVMNSNSNPTSIATSSKVKGPSIACIKYELLGFRFLTLNVCCIASIDFGYPVSY